mmetsp:Transcript_17596/g.23171  ORF Transcript_17596/g.23171 Transcript_17596/m.23171 type:complete len:84 (-) Transcript_17596:965-1216(-)
MNEEPTLHPLTEHTKLEYSKTVLKTNTAGCMHPSLTRKITNKAIAADKKRVELRVHIRERKHMCQRNRLVTDLGETHVSEKAG